MPIILDPISPPAPPAGPPVASLPATPSLAMIEQELARRCGPFMLLATDPQSPTISTSSFAVIPELRTLIDQDLVTNLYALRRGVLADGTPTPEPIPSYDRIRTVYAVDATSGRLEPDRAWQVSPYPNEQFEVHHLHPDLELFPAVQAGLRRCFFEDRLQMPPGYYYEWDVTDALPYITDQQQIRRAQVGPWPSGWPGWWRGPLELPYATYGESGHIWMRISGSVYWGPFWGGVLLTVHRSHFSFVNGMDQPGGPLLDTDVLSVDIDWVVSAAHIEAWVRNTARMQAAAATGLQPTQQMAAAEFQRQGFLHRLPIYDPIQFDRMELWSLGGGNYSDATYRGARMVVNS